MADIITSALVSLDSPIGASKEEVIRSLAERVVAQGRATDATALATNALEREAQAATGMPGGIAIPHCRSKAVTAATLAMARLNPTVDFGAPDGGADLVFFIAVPDGADQAHLVLLSKLARSLIKDEFVAALRAAKTPDDIVALVNEAVADEPAAAPAPAAAPTGKPVIVAVTACPTGIAHT